MPPVGFEPTISAGERPQTNALDRAATGTGTYQMCRLKFTFHNMLDNVDYNCYKLRLLFDSSYGVSSLITAVKPKHVGVK